MRRWQRDQHGLVHHFTDGVADCDVIHDPKGRADDRDPVCPNCLAIVRPELGLAPSWVPDHPDHRAALGSAS
jgi:hypothetical protein